MYGMYHMTEYGSYVAFPIGYVQFSILYNSPLFCECIFKIVAKTLESVYHFTIKWEP